jgi:hypothetical protein
MFIPWTDCLAGANNDIPTIQCVFPLFHNVITAALLFGGLVALIFLIWGGVKLLRSQGDQKQVQGARQTITYALIGLILIFLSFFIVNIVGTITGLDDCLTKFTSFQDCK